MNSYLIPANSKKSMLKFSVFNNTDLAIFIVGIAISLLLLMILPIDRLLIAFLAITPGCICAFLVMPVPNYHNVRTFIKIAWEFYTTRQKYIWKGWCFSNGEEETSKK